MSLGAFLKKLFLSVALGKDRKAEETAAASPVSLVKTNSNQFCFNLPTAADKTSRWQKFTRQSKYGRDFRELQTLKKRQHNCKLKVNR